MSNKLVTNCYNTSSSSSNSGSTSSGSVSRRIRSNDFSFRCFDWNFFVGRTHEVVAGVEATVGVVVAVGLQEGNIHHLKVLSMCECCIGAQEDTENVAHGKALAEAQKEVPEGALAINNDVECSHTHHVYHKTGRLQAPAANWN